MARTQQHAKRACSCTNGVSSSSAAKGRAAEQVAVDYLLGLGWSILGTRLRTEAGELDVLCVDKQQLVIVEVKARSSNSRGRCLDAVDQRKVRRLLAGGLCWLSRSQFELPVRMRLDVIAVELQGGLPIYLCHHKDVLGG